MISLANNQIGVSILDPESDRKRLGARYCTGGYIFQIEDQRAGPLLTGPTYPESFNVYDGQGIPDSFSRMPLRDPQDLARALVIGVGICRPAEGAVESFCGWDVQISTDSVVFETRQSLGPFVARLRRQINLGGRSVRSFTKLENLGSVGFQVSWFPHPFFPQPEDDDLCRVSVPIRVRPNDGFELGPNRFIRRKGWPWQTDYYLSLDHDASAPVTVLQRHPKLGLVAGSTSYVPRFFPIWGNPSTFSWEPYFENSIAPGQTLSWGMTYDF